MNIFVDSMYIVASDLDRTLLPNGSYEYDGSMSIFRRIIQEENPILIYATGRTFDSVQKAINHFNLPNPNYIIAEVGTRIYYREQNRFKEDKEWLRIIKSTTSGWDIDQFKEQLADLNGLRLQETDKQNRFKLSYYVNNPPESGLTIKNKASQRIKILCKHTTVVFSINEYDNVGYLDVLPHCTTKLGGMEYLRSSLGFKKNQVIYCGDSGNDLKPLTCGYKGIVVRNATNRVKKIVRTYLSQNNLGEHIYIAKGYKNLNGNYVSGNIEGLIKLGVVPSNYV